MPDNTQAQTILVTGAAGFIGMHVCRALLARGERVVGIDNLNDYYDPALKQARLRHIGEHPAIRERPSTDGHPATGETDEHLAIGEQPGFTFLKGDIADAAFLEGVFAEHKPVKVINLAAQAGVRYSLENPAAYVQSNLVGFANLLECCRHHATQHLVYASSSSVYGANTKVPFAERDNVDHPVSLYAATKKSNELMAHTYSHLFALPTTGLRFFTVYGPWGRPDMSPWLFTSAILEGRPLKVFNHGEMQRDFTYIDDIVTGVLRVLDQPPGAGTTGAAPYHSSAAKLASVPPSAGTTSAAPYRIFNIGNNQPVKLMDYIRTIEKAAGKQAVLEMHPMQPGDVPATYADIEAIEQATGFRPSTPLAEGIARWTAWYRDYHVLPSA